MENKEMKITGIYGLKYQKYDPITHIGYLTNERKFNINDNVWFCPSDRHGEIVGGVIIGLELVQYPSIEREEYRYKIKLPAESVRFINGFNNMQYDDITCEKIFTSLSEAKECAIKKCLEMYNLQMKEIEDYFSQFNEKY